MAIYSQPQTHTQYATYIVLHGTKVLKGEWEEVGKTKRSEMKDAKQQDRVARNRIS